MDDFEILLTAERNAVDRLIKFQIPIREDAEDVLQEVCLTAFRKFSQLQNRDSFKPWLISIARNKCNDYFRKKAAQLEIPIGELEETEVISDSKYGIAEVSVVRETLSLLGDKDKQILYLYYWKELPQAEIARQLNIPVGTVKSRLYTAKQNFKEKYPYHTTDRKGKGEKMKCLPEIMPEYQIRKSEKEPFSVKWEELMGWFLVPKPGEKLSWGMYDSPSGRCDCVYQMEVTGRAKVHGIEGVELTAKEIPCSDKEHTVDRVFVAQLTDTHCRYLATIRNDGGVRNYITFLDGDEFLPNWGFGENNCGNETNLSVKGDIQRSGSVITSKRKDFLLDIVGRYTVIIGGKSYDTVCVMDIETYNAGVVSEQYLDRHGRTILWRRFNRNDWAIDHYGKLWSEQLPENERITVNGGTYVHWYDCVTDYIF
ncbi:MAG: sigma-70 family RNA polymerase sigma factor [Lachnospiraceae bacterium]|nr:sigma-70 family RNA polymerase sigma factor [Lachnospiraceae bacterium]